MTEFAIHGWIIATGVAGAVACALLGNFLLLRRLSMMGDAITHAVLPGIAAGFILTGSRDSIVMFVGAGIVGVLTAVFTQIIHRYGQVEQSAAMGVVFTSLFALGLVMIVQGADHVDLDPGCVLYGAIELVPLDLVAVFGFEMPRALVANVFVLILDLIFVIVFFKELRIAAFDPELATTLGINAQVMHYGLMVLTAITTVACFESVGSILVIAMLIVPAAVAQLLTRRLWTMVIMSAVVAAVSAAGGHLAAITLPKLVGFEDTTTAGMMAVVAGAILAVAVTFSPYDGLSARLWRALRLRLRVAREDVLSVLFKLEEMGESADSAIKSPAAVISAVMRAGGTPFWIVKMAMHQLKRDGLIVDGPVLGDTGRERASTLVRSHRLWEIYLHQIVGKPVDKIHPSAERFEHVTDPALQEALAARTESPEVDPHGKRIP